jgi:hypothetical protein
MEEGGPLAFLHDQFRLTTCQGTEKLLSSFTTWELLNVTPDDILNIPDRLYEDYLITSEFLQQALDPYIMQTTPKDDPVFVGRFQQDGIRLDHIGIVTSGTKHYSWPKGAGQSSLYRHLGQNNNTTWQLLWV